MNYEEEIATAMAEILEDAEKMFKQALDDKHLVMTAELKDSFERNIIKTATGLAGQIAFEGYGRLKDMKKLSYNDRMPPVSDMAFFVERIGINKFAFVPGYQNKTPTSIKDINRIAWAISMSRKVKIDINRPYKGTWYNETKMKMINKARTKMSSLMSSFVTWQVAQQLEEKE